MRLPRWVHRLYAAAGGWFWLPCPACGEHFGGHEAGNCSRGTRTVCRRCSASLRCCGGVTVNGERLHLSYAGQPAGVAAVTRLVCWLRGHQPVKVIERVKLDSVTPWGAVWGIVAARLECRRCGRTVIGVPPRRRGELPGGWVVP
jgi:hypothetical protein